MECSAKSGYNTNKVFEVLTAKIIDKVEKGLIDTTDDSGGVKLG